MKLKLVVSILLIDFVTAQAGQLMPAQGLVFQGIRLGQQNELVGNQILEIKERKTRALKLHTKIKNRALNQGENKFNNNQTRMRIQQPR